MLEEIEKAEKIDFADEKAYRKSVLKLLSLQLKLLHNVRTNQTVDMKSRGVELKKPGQNEEEATS